MVITRVAADTLALGAKLGADARRAEAGVPEAVAFATKAKLGCALLARGLAAGVPCPWVVGDSADSADPALRRAIEQRGHGYVLAVTGAQRLGSARAPATAPTGRVCITRPSCPCVARPRAGARACWCGARSPSPRSWPST